MASSDLTTFSNSRPSIHCLSPNFKDMNSIKKTIVLEKYLFLFYLFFLLLLFELLFSLCHQSNTTLVIDIVFRPSIMQRHFLFCNCCCCACNCIVCTASCQRLRKASSIRLAALVAYLTIHIFPPLGTFLLSLGALPAVFTIFLRDCVYKHGHCFASFACALLFSPCA